MQNQTRSTPVSATGRRILGEQRGAIDLASVMVGVLVTALLGSAMAATFLLLVPYAQDEEARSALTSARSAQSAARITFGEFLDGDGLDRSELLPGTDSMDIRVDPDGVCYIAASKSATGRVLYSTQYRPGVVTLDVARAQCGLVVMG